MTEPIQDAGKNFTLASETAVASRQVSIIINPPLSNALSGCRHAQHPAQNHRRIVLEKRFEGTLVVAGTFHPDVLNGHQTSIVDCHLLVVEKFAVQHRDLC